MAKNEVVTTESTTELVEHKPELQVAIDPSDMMVPFLKVIQSLSEEVMPGKDKYNEEVKPGDIYDSVTRSIFREAKVIICGLKKYYAEWTPEVRGTLCGKHKADSAIVKNAERVKRITDKGNEFYALKTAEGNDLIETYGVVMIVRNKEGLTLPAVLTLSKTSFAVGKQLSTILAIHQSKGIPVFVMSTSATSNSKGSWYKPTFNFLTYEKDPEIISMAQGMATVVDKVLFASNPDEEGISHTVTEDEEIF